MCIKIIDNHLAEGPEYKSCDLEILTTDGEENNGHAKKDAENEVNNRRDKTSEEEPNEIA